MSNMGSIRSQIEAFDWEDAKCGYDANLKYDH